MKGLAVIQTAFPGDVILTGGLIRSVRARWPDLPLALIVRPDTEALARMSGSGLEVIVFDKRGGHAGRRGLRRLADELAAGPWDAALVVHRSLRSALLARRAGFELRVGFELGGGALLHTVRVPYRRGVHELERNHDLLRALHVRLALRGPDRAGAVPALLPPRFTVPAEGWTELTGLLPDLVGAAPRTGPVLLAPGSVWPTKRWPAAAWVELARRLERAGEKVVWIGGPGEAALGAELASESGVGRNAAGCLSWTGTAALLTAARIMVANDSAPVHLAGALDCPVVALFGPTVPGFGFAPFAPPSVALGLRLGCRPCRLHGSPRCPEGHFRCLHDLRPEVVADVVAHIAAGDPSAPGD